MAIKDILLFLDDSKTNPQRIDAAIAIARQHDANLTGVVLGSMKPVHAPTDEDQQATERMAEKMALKLVDEFTRTANDQDLGADSIIIYGDAKSSALKMAHYARNYDLVILTQPNPGLDNFIWLQQFAQDVLLHSGRPIFFMPYIGYNRVPCERVLVAWDGTPAVSRALHDAIPLLRFANEVIILVVASAKQQQSKKEVLVEGLVKHLANHGVDAHIRQVNPGNNNVPSVILNQITENDIDLLIMGGHGTPTLKHKIFGSVTRSLLSSMVVPVLIAD